MKILHCCLAAFFIDDYGYQENILPAVHQRQGHDVAILASTETYVEPGKLGYVKPSVYETKDGITVTRIPYVKWLPIRIGAKLRIYDNLYDQLIQFGPDVVFLHDCQFLSVTTIRRYQEKNPHVVVYIDGHTDYINSARSWLSKHILHHIIYRWCAQHILPVTKKFWGTLPLRADFFHTAYGIPKDRIGLLPIGVDLDELKEKRLQQARKSTRDNYGITSQDFVIVTGGKLDARKNTLLLLKAIKRLVRSYSVKLIVFGKPTVDMKNVLERYLKDEHVINLGWVHPKEIPTIITAGDLAVFPGTHSVVWEQVVGLGVPAIFKKWIGIQHVDIGGNCIFLEENSFEVLESSIKGILDDTSKYVRLVEGAQKEEREHFWYDRIAQKSIGNE